MFDTFDLNRRGTQTGEPDTQLGFFFTSSFADVRDWYYPKKVGGYIKVYLSVQNPLRLEHKNADLDTVLYNTATAHLGFRPRTRKDWQAYRDYLRDRGFDGIEFYGFRAGVGRREFVVFEPTQIKSATANVGTFDPHDPNMLRNPLRWAQGDPMKTRRNTAAMPNDAEAKRRLQKLIDRLPLPPGANATVISARVRPYEYSGDYHDEEGHTLEYEVGGYTDLDADSALARYRGHDLHRIVSDALGVRRGDEDALLEDTDVLRDRRDLRSHPGFSVVWSGTLLDRSTIHTDDGDKRADAVPEVRAGKRNAGFMQKLLADMKANPRARRAKAPRRENGFLASLALVGIGMAAGIYVEEQKGVAARVRSSLKGKDKVAREQFDRLKRGVLEAKPRARETQPRPTLAIRTSAPITVRSSVMAAVTDPAWVREESPDGKGYTHARTMKGTPYEVFERVYGKGNKVVVLDVGEEHERINAPNGQDGWPSVAAAKRAAEALAGMRLASV